MKTLIFFEKKADRDLIRKFFSQDRDTCFIALSPEASYELEKKGIVYKTPSAYVSHDDLKELHHSAEEKLNELMEYLDKKIKDYDGRFKENNMTPFFNSAYKFKVFFDNLLIKTFELNKILKEESPDRVVYYSHIKQPIEDTLLVDNRESVYGQVLAYSAFRNGYNNLDWVELNSQETKENFFNICKQKLLKQAKVLIKEILLPILEHISNKKISKTKNKILISKAKNFNYIIPHLRKLGIKPIRINRRKIKKIKYMASEKLNHWQEFMYSIERDCEVSRLCNFEGRNFFGLLKERFAFFVKTLEGYYRLYMYFSDFLKKEKIYLVLQETYSPHIVGNASLVEAAKKLNIPKACWIHGGSCSFGPGWPFIDYRFTDYYLVYGNKMKEFIDKTYKDYQMDVRVVGCPYIENLNERITKKREKKQIVYAIRDYFYNGHYLGWNDPDYRDDKLWDINRETLDCLRKFQDRYDVILKLLPRISKNSLFKRYLKDKGFNKVKIIEGEKNIYQLVPGTDLFIFDFISTGFFEASIGEGEIFVYSKANYPEDIKEIIKTRAYLYDDLNNFLNKLDSYLGKGSFRRSSHSPAFIEQYLNIGKGENNISAAVNTIVKIAST